MSGRCFDRLVGYTPAAAIPRILFAVLIFAAFPATVRMQSDGATSWQDAETRLVRMLQGDSEQKRTALAEIRNWRTENASRLAIAALRDRDEVVQATATASVVFLPEQDAVTVLAPVLDDRSELVRRDAAYALAEVGSPLAVASLVERLRREKVQDVRSSIAIALGASRDNAALRPLIAILNERPKEENEFVRRSAARGIGHLALRLQSQPVTPQNFLPVKFKDTRSIDAADLPIFLPAVPILSAILGSTVEAPDTRREAAFSLGVIASPASRGAIERCSLSEDPYMAEICKGGLLRIAAREH